MLVPTAVAIMICPIGPGTAMRRTAIRSAVEKMKANAEHEQNHTDFCELFGDLAIGHKARVDGPMRTPAMR